MGQVGASDVNVEQEALAEELIQEGLPTDVETILGLFWAQQAAVASLTWEGWDLAAPGVVDWLEGYRELKRRGQDRAPRLLLDGYADVESDQADGPLRAGGLARLHGYWLRFRPSDPRQGVFFLPQDGAPVRAQEFTFIGLRELALLVPPDLPPGPYRLELRTIVLPCHGLQCALLPRQLTILAAEG